MGKKKKTTAPTKKTKKKSMKIETQKSEETPIAKRKRKSTNYIDNEKMYAEMVDYSQKIKAYQKTLKELSETDEKPPKPRVSEYIGSCILMIANRLSTRPNFANYVHREEMIGDAIENCLLYVDNFNPNKSKNPFAYFTQIIYFAFLRRIQKEKKQMYVRMKVLENMDSKGLVRKNMREHGYAYGNGDTVKDTSQNVYADVFNLKQSDIDFFEGNKEKKPIESKSNKKKSSKDDTNLKQCFE